MPDIVMSFPIDRDVTTVFDAMTSPSGLDTWWTLDSDGTPEMGAWYRFGFGPATQWSGVVTRCEAPHAFEWTMGDSDPDWQGTRVGVVLTETPTGVHVEFAHRGWRDANAHFRGSTYCWATYLRILKRALEHGDRVAYADRDRA